MLLKESHVTSAERYLTQAVDAGFAGIILVAPWFMGGRHPLGELVLVALASIVLAWLAKQTVARREPPGGGLSATICCWPPVLLASCS